MRRLLTTFINQVLLKFPLTQRMNGDVRLRADVPRRMVVGLGNPGMGGSRHSVGMAFLTVLAERLGVSEQWETDKRVSGSVALCRMGNLQLVLLRPRLLMNVNGVSVAKAAARFGIRPEDIFLVHDELDKPLGKFAVKQGGSARGHNGVRSCAECLQTDLMPRIRIGIGRPSGKVTVERHVLGRFSQEEQKILSVVLEQSVDRLLSLLTATDMQHSPSPPEGSRGKSSQKDEGLQHLPSSGDRSTLET